ncbi:cell wall binding repeat-containing protein [Clostridium sp. DL-VIII]|uniref:cell wall binding repeat-containing protein n=1 Tax=Clostridium sp. DL-VIII TaxID=641107 RepID=UPI00023B0447|nr:cell wall binding repeat-containing protein [Clostridium sp. DL-VIII]EHJ00731.1 cell wall binding repeat-containing protein [Clostridium sp. DL-VIII]
MKKLIILTMILISILTMNPIVTHAEWKQDNNGWWNSEGSSWSVGWKEIDGKWYYFDDNGYMKTG